jgi:hypothetical protein
MSSLPESRIHHRWIRILPRKVQESNIHDEEPARRRIPAETSPSAPTRNNEDGLTRRQRSQRERRRKEKSMKKPPNSNRVDEEPPNKQVRVVPSDSHSMKNNGDYLTRRQRGQRQRRQRERDIRRVSVLSTARLLRVY